MGGKYVEGRRVVGLGVITGACVVGLGVALVVGR